MPSGHTEAVTRVLSRLAVGFALCAPVAIGLLAWASERPAVSGWTDIVVYVPAMLVSAAIGYAILLRRDGNPIGWLLLGNGCVLALSGLAAEYAGLAYSYDEPLPGGRAAAVWDTSGWPLLFAGIVAIAWCFPDGRLLSRRWRPLAVVGVVSFASMLVGGVLGHETLDAPFQRVEPWGVLSDAASQVLQYAGLLGMFASIVLGAACLVIRFRRATGAPRQQVKYLALVSVLIPVAIVIGTIDGGDSDPGPATELSLGLVLSLVPLAIGLAVLRYRLYDIDRLISSTVLYATLTLLLGGAFLAIVLVGGLVLGRGSVVPTAVAACAITLVFRRLRDVLQRQVDRRFNRSRYSALTTVDGFLSDVRRGRAEPEGVERVLAEALGDPGLRLLYWLPRQDAHADRSGAVVAELPGEPSRRTPVRRGSLDLATLVHSDGAQEPNPELVDTVVARAGLAIEVARLRVEVRRQLAEVEASRARIVSAGEAERRRIERDLHDGAQQQLVALGLELRGVQGRLRDEDAARTVDEVVRGLGVAVRELRDLAHGVRPRVLDAGLTPALHELAARSPVSTHVESTVGDCSADACAAAYFVVNEALANAVKHASAQRIEILAERQNGVLRVVVSDNGRGAARPSAGTGLQGLVDRVSAMGGSLAVDSPAGRGTRIEMRVPCD